MTKKFGIGDEVRITAIDKRVNGKTAVIVGYEPDADCPYIVELDGVNYSKFPSLDYEWAFIEDELELVDAQQPAPAASGTGTGDVQWLEADYRATVKRLHGIAEKHKLPTPPGEYIDVTIEREFDRLQSELARVKAANERLRAALEDIADGDKMDRPNGIWGYDQEMVHKWESRAIMLAGIAREALQAGE